MVKRALLLTAGLLLLLPLYATFAQDQGVGTPTPSPSPTPEAGVIVRHGVELIFPVELEFSLIVSLPPGDIESGEVILSQDSGYQETIDLNLDNDLNFADDESLEIRKPIRFTPQNAPRPFERLDYEWRITSSQGTDNLADWIIFQPGGAEWQSTPADTLKIYWHNANLGADVLREEFLPVVNLMESHVGGVADLDFVIYDANFEICESSEHPCSRDSLTEYYAEHGIAFVQPDQPGLDALQNDMIEALVMENYTGRWAGRDVPAWFRSGLAQLYRQSSNAGALATARNAEAQDFLLPPARLQRTLPDDADAFEQRLWDSQSYTLVLYLADSFGEEVPFDLATVFPEAENFETALQALTGMSLAENFRLWRQWLRSEAADNAATWTPYLTSINEG